MIISGAAGFFISAIAAEVYSTHTQDDLVNSVATVLTGFAASSVVFAILFHIDNKYMYIDKSTGRIDFKNLKQVLKKLMAAGLVFEVVNNSSRFIILYQLFTMDADPSGASMLSSLAASGLSYLSINLMLRRSGLFQIANKNDFYLKK
jgi:DNA-binding HxlR family transcriptional regulator